MGGVNMGKEIHIWLGVDYPENICKTYGETQSLMVGGADRIDTGITEFCSSEYFEDGFRIFAHMADDEEVEIKLGCDNKNTDRKIHAGHNLQKLLISNEFGIATLEWYQ